MRSPMTHQFSQVPRADIPRSSFDRTHAHKTTFNAGWLVPIYLDEVLPGDTFQLDLTAFARMATPIFPVMDNLFMDFFFFYVPNRLLWNNWERFNGAQDNPGDSTSYLIPTITSPAGGYLESTLYDYYGIPTKVPGLVHSALPLRAYNLIYNEWFRDENLVNSVPFTKGDGPDASTDYVLRRRGKRHDYFTSALPWPQKGPAVSLPLGSSAVVRTSSSHLVTGTGNEALKFLRKDNGASPANNVLGSQSGEATITSAAHAGGVAQLFPSNLYADLTSATAATINQLRQAFQVQRLLERDARGGTRYTEILKAHFGVTAPDFRLQRPEYLGGGSVPVNITPIAQTSASGVTGSASPQGNLAAFGTAMANNKGFFKSFVEHGYIVGIVSVRADLTYQQGLNRLWSRSTRFDFYWPALAHLGEQVVRNREIYAVGSANPTQDAAAFGYQEAWAEYRYKPSQISGLFRSNATGTLDAWHLSQNFGALPTLNQTFIEDNPPVARVVAVPSQPQFIYDSFIRLKCTRPMPLYSVPGLIDHF